MAVDLRRSSPTFGRWIGERLSGDNGCQLWIPPGFAHGFLTLSERAHVAYKCTAPYAPAHERTLRWDDPTLSIAWPLPDGRRADRLREGRRGTDAGRGALLPVTRVLVTGALGQLGSELRRTVPPGHEIVALDLPDFDLTHAADVRRVVHDAAPHAIINAAAYTAVDQAEDEPRPGPRGERGWRRRDRRAQPSRPAPD